MHVALGGFGHGWSMLVMFRRRTVTKVTTWMSRCMSALVASACPMTSTPLKRVCRLFLAPLAGSSIWSSGFASKKHRMRWKTLKNRFTPGKLKSIFQHPQGRAPLNRKYNLLDFTHWAPTLCASIEIVPSFIWLQGAQNYWYLYNGWT